MKTTGESTRPLKALALAAGMLVAPAAALAQGQAAHPMPGEIVAIDHDTGLVVVNTKPVPITIHFPVEHVQDLETGDTITVHLSYEEGEGQ